MDDCDKYALQREAMLRYQALELPLLPVEMNRADARKPVALHTVQAALAKLNAGQRKR